MIEITYIDTKEVDQKLTGLAVRFAREKLGLVQGELAKQMNCTKAYISKLELGKGNLTAKKIENIIKALSRAKYKQDMMLAHAACDEHFLKSVKKPSAAERSAFVAGWLRKGEVE